MNSPINFGATRAPLTPVEKARRAAALAQHTINGGDQTGRSTQTSTFVLPVPSCQPISEFANTIRDAAPSQKLEAFTTCAQYVFGLGDDDKFPLREKVNGYRQRRKSTAWSINTGTK